MAPQPKIEDRTAQAEGIVRMREDGRSYKEIAELTELHPVTVKNLFLEATEPRYTFDSEEALAAFVGKARDELNLSWATIHAQTGVKTRSKLWKLYEQATGRDASESDLGRGGGVMKGGGYRRREKPAGEPKPKKQRKAKEKKSDNGELTLEDAKARFEGKTVKLASGKEIVVAEVTKVTPKGVKAVSDDGKTGTIQLDKVVEVS